RMIASKPERFKEVMPGNEMAFEVFKELARTRRRNADTVDPGIGRTRLGQRTLKCVFLIGTRSAHSIRASGLIWKRLRSAEQLLDTLERRQGEGSGGWLAGARPDHPISGHELFGRNGNDPGRTLMEIKGKTVLVTGASSGVGAAIAKEMALAGAGELPLLAPNA